MALPTNSEENKNSQEGGGLPTVEPSLPAGLPIPNSEENQTPEPFPFDPSEFEEEEVYSAPAPIEEPVYTPPTSLPAPVEEDPFESLSIEEEMDDTPSEDDLEIAAILKRLDEVKARRDEIEESPTPAQPARVAPEALETPAPAVHRPEPEYSPPSVEAVEETEKNFINKQKKKLLPFGGAKSNKPKKKGSSAESGVSKYDAREDRRNKAKLAQMGVTIALVGVVFVGFYNALIPKSGVSAEEMNAAISAHYAATTGFPADRAGAFSESFLEAFLSVNPNTPEGEKVLNYYYSGSLSSNATMNTNIQASGVTQKILSPPKVFKVLPVNSYSSTFEVGALVLPASTTAEEGAKLEPKWVFYSINVFYDVETLTMMITPDSPSLIPTPNFGSSSEVPNEELLGTGKTDSDINAAVRNSLLRYLENFARSSSTNSGSLVGDLVDGANSGPELIKGLDGLFELHGDPGTAIQYTTYYTDDPNVVKIDARVTWADKKVKEQGGTLTYKSRYMIEMHKQKTGEWLVARSQPLFFFEKQKTE